MLHAVDSVRQFPCTFPIKSIGKGGEGFETRVMDVVRRHVSDLSESPVKVRESRQGKWVAVTLVIQAESQTQLDAIYQDLRRQGGVVWAI